MSFRAWFESKQADAQYNVPMSSDDIVALAKLAARQAQTISLISLQLADQACLIEPHLPKCSKCEREACTVEHVHLKLRLCDRCAAESIVKAGRAYVDGYLVDPKDPMNDVRGSLMNENDWVDLPDADKIRRVTDYVHIIKQLDVGADGVH